MKKILAVILATMGVVIALCIGTAAKPAIAKERAEYWTYSVTYLDTGETWRVWMDTNGEGIAKREVENWKYEDGVRYEVREFHRSDKWGWAVYDTDWMVMANEDELNEFISNWTDVRVEHVFEV